MSYEQNLNFDFNLLRWKTILKISTGTVKSKFQFPSNRSKSKFISKQPFNRWFPHAGLFPLAASPAFRSLYDRTLETFPSAFIVLAGSIGLVLAALNLFLFTQRSKLLFDRYGRPINGYQPEKEEEVVSEKEEKVEEKVWCMCNERKKNEKYAYYQSTSRTLKISFKYSVCKWAD